MNRRIWDTGDRTDEGEIDPAPFGLGRFAVSGIRDLRIGFTLLELLLSLALIGMLLVAMNQFIFSMGELWGRGADVRLFDRHVRAVTRFLEKTLHSTALPAAKGMQALAVEDVRLPDGPTESLLVFELPEGSHVLPWPGAPLPDVVCALGLRPDQGLVLYWHSRIETAFCRRAAARHGAVAARHGAQLRLLQRRLQQLAELSRRCSATAAASGSCRRGCACGSPTAR